MKQEMNSNIIVSNSHMSAVSKRINYEPQRTLINEYNVIQPQKVNNNIYIQIICLKFAATYITTVHINIV